MQKAPLNKISAVLFALLLLGTSVPAQQLADRPKQTAVRTLAYDATRETVLEGTVLSYSEESSAPPIGAHLLLQTANGPVDLHLGGASYLRANHFSLAKGDSVRVVGANSAMRQGSIFLVRVIQKDGQSLTLRTAKGAPLSRAGARALGLQKNQQQEGAR
jgi:hypothetical protein